LFINPSSVTLDQFLRPAAADRLLRGAQMFSLLTNSFCSPVGKEGPGTDMKR
jgi:hypothetical protein